MALKVRQNVLKMQQYPVVDTVAVDFGDGDGDGRHRWMYVWMRHQSRLMKTP